MAAYPSKTETTVGLLFRKSVESVIEWTEQGKHASSTVIKSKGYVP